MTKNSKHSSKEREIKRKKRFIKKLFKRLNKYRIRVKDEFEAPETAIGIFNKQANEYSIIGTLGNFSLIIGKPKAKKSFLVGLFLAIATLTNTSFDIFRNSLKHENRMVLYFDTEQSRYHVRFALYKICKLLKFVNPKNLKVFSLRSLTPKARLVFIEKAIYNYSNVGFVVIDGIKDLVTSINSEEEATGIASKLLKWTEERNIHVMCVLHQNKSDNNARGHLGTELINKAETVLSVTKSEHDNNISIVAPEMCRNEDPQPFAIEIIDNIPIIIEDYEERTIVKKKGFNVLEIPDKQKYQLLTEVFSREPYEFKYSELMRQIKVALYNQLKKNVGDNKIRDLITYMKIKHWLTQEKKQGPYKLNDYESVPF